MVRQHRYQVMGEQTEHEAEEVEGVEAGYPDLEKRWGRPSRIQFGLVGEGQDKTTEHEEEVDSQIAVGKIMGPQARLAMEENNRHGGETTHGVKRFEAMRFDCTLGGCGCPIQWDPRAKFGWMKRVYLVQAATWQALGS
jgi:hypothetical protein